MTYWTDEVRASILESGVAAWLRRDTFMGHMPIWFAMGGDVPDYAGDDNVVVLVAADPKMTPRKAARIGIEAALEGGTLYGGVTVRIRGNKGRVIAHLGTETVRYSFSVPRHAEQFIDKQHKILDQIVERLR